MRKTAITHSQISERRLDLTSTIESIYRYPIKGLSGEKLDSINVTVGNVIPGDREYAFARSGVSFDPIRPHYMSKKNFLALVRDEELALFDTLFDPISRVLTLSKDGHLLLEVNLSNPLDQEKICKFLADQLGISPNKQPFLVRADRGTKLHSFSDVQNKVISLINLSSIREFTGKIGVEVDPMRFRGNINFVNSIAWEEFNWLDQDLQIGNVLLRVLARTKRCAATAVNPYTGVRDLNIPRALTSNYGHMDMGIYAEVIQGGMIKVGDNIEPI